MAFPLLPVSISHLWSGGWSGPATDDGAKSQEALEAAAARNLPTPYDPKKVAGVLRGLITDAREEGWPAAVVNDPDARRIVGELADGIARNGKGHPVGIEEGQAGWYELGEGDAKTHQALRDSNLLNSVLGRKYVPNAQAVRDGNVVGNDESWELMGRKEGFRSGLNYWLKGEEHPNHWANTQEAFYPQNAWIGSGSPSNVTDNNGGSALGNALAFMGRWDNGGNRAVRAPSEQAGVLADTGKLLTGWWAGADDERTHQSVKGLVNRPSPLLPNGMKPGSGPADYHLSELTAIRDATALPKSQDYAASQGRELSRFGKAFADNKFFWADPATALSGGAGLVRGVAGKALGAGLKAAGQVAQAEAISEGLSPFNYIGFLASLTDDPKSSMTPEQYRENADKSRQAILDAGDTLGRYGR
jgi:hypothetical protein